MKPTHNTPIASQRGTSAHRPDLNWSQVRETVLMLELAASQIEAAMKDSGSSVDVLAGSFTTMASHLQQIAATADGLSDQGEVGTARQALIGNTQHVTAMVHQTIIAFQFYDKLVQRLSHVSHSLGQLGELVADSNRLFNPDEWVALQNRIKAKYSTREEVAMFEAVMQGTPVHQALGAFMAERRDNSNDIELF